MFLRIEEKVINLSFVEQIIFAQNTIVIGFTSKESLFIDSKHTERLERALITYNQIRGHEHD